MHNVQCRFKVVFHTVGEIGFGPLWQMVNVCFMVEPFAQI